MIINQYKINSLIGKGGMGEVFLAQDTRLDRKVAIKFLNEELSRDADKLNRFIQEAKAVSALNHPNILTVYEIGEHGDSNYIVTEFIDGETLRDQLASKKTISLSSVLKIGVQVAEALSASHQAGIIHRDIKPENIMIRKDGYAKVLDFGLAKLVEQKRSEDVSLEEATKALVKTNPGLVMGTVSYMSPEQARGKETDAGTDIWSLGVVLYEMLSGRIPFTGETINHTIVAILETEPKLLENVPDELQRIVRKTLAKDADMRYQTARDLLIDLKNLRRNLDIKGEFERSVVPIPDVTGQVSENETQTYTERSIEDTKSRSGSVVTSASSLEYAVTQAKTHKLATAMIALLLVAAVAAITYFGLFAKGGDQIRSIAVLPLENRSGTPDTDYLSDGLADSLIFRLSQLPNLKVSPTSSVMRYRDAQKDVVQIAKELEVDGVMSGRLVQRGDDLAISVQLIDARTGKLIWAGQYDRKMSDLLATQREIAATITEKLQLKLSGDEKGITKKYTDDNEAYQLYLKGRYHFARRTKDDLLKSIDYYQQAVNRDPNFAIGYVGIANVYNLASANAFLSGRESLPHARTAAERALVIDPSLAEAHSALAVSLALYDRSWTESEREFKKSIELDPKVAETHYYYGLLLLRPNGRFDEAIREIKLALELEPLSIPFGANLAYTYSYSGQNELALELAQRTYSLDPNHPHTFGALGFAYVVNEMNVEAIELYEKKMREDPDQIACQYFIGVAYARSGQRQKAEETIARCREESKIRFVGHWRTALVYAALGERDKAFADLDQAIQEYSTDAALLKVSPWTAPLRDDPRFKDLLKRMNLAE